VHRRLLTILLSVAITIGLASSAAGCSTFTDADSAARVNDSELSADELSELADAVATIRTEEPTSGDVVRAAINAWVFSEIFDAQLTANDTPLTSDLLTAADAQLREGLAGFTEFSDNAQTTLVKIQATVNAVAQFDQETGQAFVETATDNADVYIDSRFGRFDPELGVIALDTEPPPDTTAP
jgi:mevalonate kinase